MTTTEQAAYNLGYSVDVTGYYVHANGSRILLYDEHTSCGAIADCGWGVSVLIEEAWAVARMSNNINLSYASIDAIRNAVAFAEEYNRLAHADIYGTTIEPTKGTKGHFCFECVSPEYTTDPYDRHVQTGKCSRCGRTRLVATASSYHKDMRYEHT